MPSSADLKQLIFRIFVLTTYFSAAIASLHETQEQLCKGKYISATEHYNNMAKMPPLDSKSISINCFSTAMIKVPGEELILIYLLKKLPKTILTHTAS